MIALPEALQSLGVRIWETLVGTPASEGSDMGVPTQRWGRQTQQVKVVSCPGEAGFGEKQFTEAPAAQPGLMCPVSTQEEAFGKPQDVVKISWAPLTRRTVGRNPEPDVRLDQVCLLLASRLLHVTGMRNHRGAGRAGWPDPDLLAGTLSE